MNLQNRIHKTFIKSIIIIFGMLLTARSLSAQEKKLIDYWSNILYVTEKMGPDIKILTDSVKFYHEGSTMYCDSAQFNTTKNFFKAFGRIEIIKIGETDTVFVFGDSLQYSGATQMAVMRGNVILKQDSLTLSTDSLDYDLKTNISYYPNHGVTVNGEDTLESKLGYYYADEHELFFKDSVVVKNTRFTLYSDTLKHDTKAKISYIYGPTEIVSDSNYIYCERGNYNHETDRAQMTQNTFLRNQEKTMYGDSLFYDRGKAYGEAFRNVTIRDTVQDLLLLGHYGMYDEARDISLMTEKALFIQVSEPGDSLFMHADTLLAVNDTLKIKETNDAGEELQRDSLYRVVKAYRHVKIFKQDFQAKCDSLTYNFKDSIMQLHYEPVVWSDQNQLTATKITAYTVNGQVSQVDMDENAFAIEQSDSVRYNQVKGKKMIGYIADEELYRVDVKENGESLYFVRDDDGLLIGVNIIQCTDMIIYLENQQINRIWFYSQPKGKMHPPFTLPKENLKLPKFMWYDSVRPKKKEDVFIWEPVEK